MKSCRVVVTNYEAPSNTILVHNNVDCGLMMMMLIFIFNSILV